VWILRCQWHRRVRLSGDTLSKNHADIDTRVLLCGVIGIAVSTQNNRITVTRNNHSQQCQRNCEASLSAQSDSAVSITSQTSAFSTAQKTANFWSRILVYCIASLFLSVELREAVQTLWKWMLKSFRKRLENCIQDKCGLYFRIFS
jgi:hypothetical protein